MNKEEKLNKIEKIVNAKMLTEIDCVIAVNKIKAVLQADEYKWICDNCKSNCKSKDRDAICSEGMWQPINKQ